MDAKRRRKYRDEMQKRDVTSSPPDRRKYGERAQNAIERFLANGGTIKRYPSPPDPATSR